MTTIILIDPRPQSKEAMIAKLQEHAPVTGVEVTLPAFLPYIHRNIDDQHTPGAEGKAAIEIAIDSLHCPIPNTPTYAVVRPDLDALGAIAVLELRRRQFEEDVYLIDEEVKARIAYIAQEDKFARGSWPGVRPVQVATVTDFQAMNAICLNFKLPIETRLSCVEQYLLTGTCEGLEESREQVRATFKKIVKESVITPIDYHVVLVESAHLGATELGYHHAPILVIKNDQFRFQGGPEHTKYTICQWNEHHCDLVKLVYALNALEQSGGTWGGSKTIIGSPQGISSSIPTEEITNLVKGHRWTWCGGCGNAFHEMDLNENGNCGCNL